MDHFSQEVNVPLSAMQQTQQELEVQAELEKHQAAAKVREEKVEWDYRTERELQQSSPSIKDGLEPEKEALWRRQFMTIIQKAGMHLRIPQWAIAVAGLLCHRYFARKSMKKSCRYTVAAACLHLAAKMEEAPKAIREIVAQVVRVRYGRDKDALAKNSTPEELEKFKEAVLVAERAVLYTLGFHLNTSHPYTFLVSKMQDLELLEANQDEKSPFRTLMQNTWNLVNDSLKTTLCLQYAPEKIAVSALWLSSHLALITQKGTSPETARKYALEHGLGGVLDEKVKLLLQKRARDNPGEGWEHGNFFSFFGVTKDEVAAITSQILAIYEAAGKAGAGARAM